MVRRLCLIIGWVFAANIACAAKPVRFLVKVKSGQSANAFSRLSIRAANLQAFASESRRGLLGVTGAKEFQSMGVSLIEGDASEIEASLKNHPLVEYYEKERFWKINSVDLPSSETLSPWLSQVLDLNDPAPSETVAIQSPETIVAVVDTGVTFSHPYLSSAITRNSREINGTNGVDDDGNGYVDDKYGGNVLDYSGSVSETSSDHGSHVAGLIKSVRDQAIAEGFSKAARVSILPVRFINASGMGSTSGAIEALDYALKRGAKVINASWGAKGTDAFSRALYDSLVELYNQDVVIAVAAGNYQNGVANDNDLIPYFPSSYNIPSLISVASITPTFTWVGAEEKLSSLNLSHFSNYGANSVDLVAPGSYEDGDGNEVGVYSANGRYPGYSGIPYIRKRGTSMATPLVAGVAGVVRAINPNLTAYEVKKVIVESLDLSSKYSKTKSSGSLNARAAFRRAKSTPSHSLKPALDSERYYGQNLGLASDSETDGGGGCMSVRDLHSSSKDGPFGGNSLLLFAASYFLYLGVRKLSKQYKHSSSD